MTPDLKKLLKRQCSEKDIRAAAILLGTHYKSSTIKSGWTFQNPEIGHCYQEFVPEEGIEPTRAVKPTRFLVRADC